MKSASVSYRTMLRERNSEAQEKDRKLQIASQLKPLNKTQTLLKMREEAELEWVSHLKSQKKEARIRLLQEIAAKRDKI